MTSRPTSYTVISHIYSPNIIHLIQFTADSPFMNTVISRCLAYENPNFYEINNLCDKTSNLNHLLGPHISQSLMRHDYYY